jgi:hypothetical protein
VVGWWEYCGIRGHELDKKDRSVCGWPFNDGSHTVGVVNGCLASPRYDVDGNHVGVTAE